MLFLKFMSQSDEAVLVNPEQIISVAPNGDGTTIVTTAAENRVMYVKERFSAVVSLLGRAGFTVIE
ncbi:hypothetical protein [Pleomorphomonas sp. NRK KF1]|uniref:hypothetical protein n=1 Tax=Pleomorphomonas sp. NRK KF1 TaxID=2943000 RepID=UPI0020437DA4|nr:hypothetical protein [Pleomorphomonas sp. NRK KF1]MCM5555720.1 hypothetical protein [Pleomorphomonas sp. NRK KF1]